jgi:hypothetical protein
VRRVVEGMARVVVVDAGGHAGRGRRAVCYVTVADGIGAGSVALVADGTARMRILR